MADAPGNKAVGKHPCPECGGDLQWSPVKQALQCPYCGAVVPWSEAQAADPGTSIVEQDLATVLESPLAQRGFGDKRVEVQCQSCGATVTFTPPEVARLCDFCGAQIVAQPKSADPMLAPEAILPFSITQPQANAGLRQWLSSRWFAPTS